MGVFGACSAPNWTKFWTKFQITKARFLLPDRGGFGSTWQSASLGLNGFRWKLCAKAVLRPGGFPRVPLPRHGILKNSGSLWCTESKSRERLEIRGWGVVEMVRTPACQQFGATEFR